ncbi:hypothetical protein CYLTODRAFT_451458 [Cylindrobasidium torrendii FP15055 ss-10]|uniref:Microsomal glutathione S-transferase 3 n=1 Tax=Cylindrobasidium torrendii FP15055 ss-10 TaxID=1314674 RepID=A0A0D7BKG6_9AGAR|nr:hypothetical protein CYLTODRAFT_451458 [Cylindrobasidium torrendii FP15055 ss-10]
MPFILPDGIEYVGLALISTQLVLLFQEITVGHWRKISKIKYPQLYAEKAEMEANPDAVTFNCAQRAHANTLENVPIILVGTLVTAMKYPIFAAVTCGLWSFSKFRYTRGYLKGADKRNSRGGILGSIMQLR